MPIHSAIKSFLDRSTETIAVSSLSCLVSTLHEINIAQEFITQHREMCREVMARLITLANDNGKNANVRLLSIECLYALSNVANDEFRRGDLLNAIHKLNESFEAFLEGQISENSDQQHEMLTILLFRCSGYNRLKAGDLLHQLFNGNDTRLVATLQNIIKNRSLEYEIIHACVRCMYELTTPVSYFTAPSENESIETTKINAFQDKITVLLIHLSQKNALMELFNEINSRWALTMQESQLNQVINGQIPITSHICDILSKQYLPIFRYLTVMFLNVADFCERMELVKSYQQSFMIQHQSFLGATLIPFIQISLQCWEITKETTTNGNSENNPFMNVAISALRMLRFALYRAAQPPHETLSLSLCNLSKQAQSLENRLCREYVGMLILVLVIESLCNVNAAIITTAELNSYFKSLVETIASDKTPLRPGAEFTGAQAFAYCIANETSTYCVSENDSIIFLRQKLQEEDAEAINEATQAIQVLEEQLGMLQALMMELAVGQLLSDLCLMSPFGEIMHNNNNNNNNNIESRGRSSMFAHIGASGESDNNITSAESRQQKTNNNTINNNNNNNNKKNKKVKHPAKYVCMLTKKLMREPVVLNNGHHFEFDALQEVVERVGHVDPLTGEAIHEELNVDLNLQQEIARYRVERAARAEATTTE